MKRRMTTIVTLLLLVAVTFSSGYLVGSQQTAPVVAQDTSDRDELFQPFWEAWDLLHDYYVDPLEDEDLLEGAITGMMSAPGDPHTDYMPPDRFTQAREGLSGEYEGIGATVRKDEETGALIIVRPLPDSPAEAAGLMPGDEVVTVDGQNITDMDQTLIISMVKGPAGTEVVLGIRREGEEELIEITVTRARIDLPSLDYEILENDIAYVTLYNFGAESDEDLANALEEIDIEARAGLILDLRGNTGGYLDTSLEIISMFIEQGTIFIERGANNTEDKVQAYGNPIAPNIPMVLLVDGFSASASELVAGALQDHERATVIGETTFGKGSVQSWRQLSNGGGIRITIARWFTPLGRSVEPDGLDPDIEVIYDAPADEPYDRANDNQLQAAIEYLEELVPEGPQAQQTVPLLDVPSFS
ncbi:MAG: S41 family peptidase [Chloroflexi bacterium]|nr:S41 family peptidase [Chloroflexota bacterium]